MFTMICSPCMFTIITSSYIHHDLLIMYVNFHMFTIITLSESPYHVYNNYFTICSPIYAYHNYFTTCLPWSVHYVCLPYSIICSSCMFTILILLYGHHVCLPLLLHHMFMSPWAYITYYMLTIIIAPIRQIYLLTHQ